MIIHHLASTREGGAGRAAENLATALGRQTGQTHRLFSAHTSAQTTPWTGLFAKTPRDRRLPSRWARLLLSLAKKGRPRSPEPLNLAHVGTIPPRDHPFWNCDILHLHWLGDSWLDFRQFAAAIPAHIPVVWTLHDLNAVSAICHYPGSACDALPSGCETCPWVGGATGTHTLRASFSAKDTFFRATTPHLVTICAWQDRLVRNAPLGLLAADIRLIGYAFDADKYDADQTRAKARIALGLDATARYALLGAASLKNHRKGADLALDAAPAGWRWLTFGAGGNDLLPGADSVHFSKVSDPQKLAVIYAAADIFVLPSREECLAQTGLEALANGTPVLTFSDTGPADYVIPGETGLLAGHKDSASLRACLTEFPAHATLQNQDAVRAAFRRLHARHFALPTVSAQYTDLYLAALANPRKRV